MLQLTDVAVDAEKKSENVMDSHKMSLLRRLISEENEEKFIKEASSDTEPIDIDVLLLEASQKKQVGVVKYLLDLHTITSKNINNILLKLDDEHEDIFNLLVRHPMTNTDNILSDMLKSMRYRFKGQTKSFKCYKRLMKHKLESSDLNKTDSNGNYPLYYAAEHGGQRIVLELLDRGASLANRNGDGSLNVEHVDSDTLKKHLDGCISVTHSSRKDTTVMFNYESLFPEKIDDFGSEMEVLYFMRRSPNLKKLLQHPIIGSFLMLKWNNLQWTFWINFLFFLTFCVSLVLFVFDFFYHDREHDFYKWFLGVTTTLLALRECFQLVRMPLKYFLNFDNYVQLILIAESYAMLFVDNPDDKARKLLCSFSLLPAALALLNTLNTHPLTSTIVLMFKRVSVNFIKFLISYMVLILPFAFSFHFLFRDDVDGEDENNDDNDEGLFGDSWTSIYKVLIMFAGEFEASSLNLERYPWYSYILVLIFVFALPIVLMNLLNGLAVSDTAMIINEANYYGQKARCDYLEQIESLLLFILKIEHRLFGRAGLSKLWNRSVRVFKDNYTLRVFPYQNNRICLNERHGKHGKRCDCKVSVLRPEIMLEVLKNIMDDNDGIDDDICPHCKTPMPSQ